MAKRLSFEQVLAILAEGTFNDFIGAVEDGHLECKGPPYQLQHDYQKQELAKDVSAIANLSARTGLDGGHILLGVQTKKSAEHPGDVIASVNPFASVNVDPTQYLQVINTRIVPVPEGVEVKWYPSADNPSKGIVAITVPRQPADLWPFIVTKLTDDESGKVSGNTVAYFERRGEHVVPRTSQELQRLLRDGHRFDALSKQIDALAEQVKGLGQQALAQPSPGPSLALQSYDQRRAQAVVGAGLHGTPVFALTAAPVQTITLPTLFRGRDDQLVRLLDDPPELRVGGFDVTAGRTEIVEGKLRRGVIPNVRLLECWQDGTLIFLEDAGALCWGMEAKVKGALRINQMALAESAYLFAYLAQQVYAHAAPNPPEEVEFKLTLDNMSVGGVPAVLAPNGLKTPASVFGFDLKDAPEASAEFPVRVSGQWNPGRPAYRLVVAVYTWFGFSEDEIPYAVDESGARVISPDKLRAAGT